MPPQIVLPGRTEAPPPAQVLTGCSQDGQMVLLKIRTENVGEHQTLLSLDGALQVSDQLKLAVDRAREIQTGLVTGVGLVPRLAIPDN